MMLLGPAYRFDGRAPYLPEVAVVLDGTGARVLTVEAHGDAMAATLTQALRQALTDPATLAGRAPTRLRTHHGGLRDALASAFPDLEVVSTDEHASDELCTEVIDEIEDADGPWSALAMGATPETIAGLCRYAAGLHEDDPWREVPGLRSPLVVTLGETKGVVSVEPARRWESGEMPRHLSLWLEDADGPERPPWDVPMDHLALTFGTADDLSAEQRAEHERHGWATTLEGLYPEVIAWDTDGTPRPPTEAEARLMEALVLGVGMVHIDLSMKPEGCAYHRSFSVELHDGSTVAVTLERTEGQRFSEIEWPEHVHGPDCDHDHHHHDAAHVHGPGCDHDHHHDHGAHGHGVAPAPVATSGGPELALGRVGAPPLAKVGRNEPCPCGSGKKHKKCCGAPG